jgi:hypothetical protein
MLHVRLPINKTLEASMKERRNVTLDIHQNVKSLTEPLCHVANLVEFFSDGFDDRMTHDDSEQTRKVLRTVGKALLKNLEKLCNVLYAIDPDLVFEWKLTQCNAEDRDPE